MLEPITRDSILIKASSLSLVMMLFLFVNFVGQDEVSAHHGELFSGLFFVFTYYPFALFLPKPLGLLVYLILLYMFLCALGKKSYKSYVLSFSLSLMVLLIVVLDAGLTLLEGNASGLSAIGAIFSEKRPTSLISVLVASVFLASFVQLLNFKKKPLINSVISIYSGYVIMVHLFLLN